MCNLALLLLEGKAAPKDPAEAEKLLLRAAEMGDTKAQYNLGMVLLNGQDIPQNVEQAYFWLALAERHGIPEATVARQQAAKELGRAQKEALDAKILGFKPRTAPH
jgi:hypothetical protein